MRTVLIPGGAAVGNQACLQVCVHGSFRLALRVVALPICVFSVRVSADAFRLLCLWEPR